MANKNLKDRKLTDKQQKFIQEYLIDFNQTQAAIRAGYSKKTANRIASKMLMQDHIQNALSERVLQVLDATQLTQEDVLYEIKSLLKSRMSDYYKKGKGGELVPKDPRELTDMQIAAIKEIKFEETSPGKKKPVYVLWSKEKAIEHAVKILQLIPETPDIHFHDSNVLIMIPTNKRGPVNKNVIDAESNGHAEKNHHDADGASD